MVGCNRPLPLPSAFTSELVLQCQLNLAHRDSRRADHSETLTRGIGRRSSKCCSGENVPAGRTPGRMVERVERFEPELDEMMLVIRKLESLMQRQVDRLEMRRRHSIPSDIAESSSGRLEERRRIVPAGGSAFLSIAIANPRVAGAIRSLIAGAGVVDAADGDVLRDAALNCHARAQLPAP